MLQAPSWELTSEYPAIESKEFQRDFALAEKMTADFSTPSGKPTIDEIVKAIVRERDASTLLSNLSVHCMNLFSENTKDELAKKWSKKVKDATTNLNVKYLPYKLASQYLSDAEFDQLISNPEIAGEKFLLQRERMLNDFMLSREEEAVIEKMRGTGAINWYELYDGVCAAMEIEMDIDGKKKTVSLGQAQSFTKGSNEKEKKAAWLGLQKAWKTHEQPAAHALNSLAEWSFNQLELRSKKKKLHFLDPSLHDSRISKQSLETMYGEIEKALPQLQKALVRMAQILDKRKLDSWDLVSAGPESTGKLSFEEAFSKIEKGFQAVDPELAQFGRMMLEKKWIEAADREDKSGGGYCTTYIKSLHPRIFQTFKGSYSDTFTVAHELGHAFHSWVMRDLPIRQMDYPMTLAETASNFGEFALYDYLQKAEGKTPQVEWLFLDHISSYLINVVARFYFEKAFYERRQHGILSAKEISDLQVEIWKQWYGDHVNQIETHFWANKIHFYFPPGMGPTFYNYPYTVGFLLSQSIYAQRDRFGKEFWPRYKALLRDTGIMTCEDVVKKHLGFDLREPQFWREGLESLIAKI